MRVVTDGMGCSGAHVVEIHRASAPPVTVAVVSFQVSRVCFGSDATRDNIYVIRCSAVLGEKQDFITRNRQRAAKSRLQRADSRDQRAESRAENREQRS